MSEIMLLITVLAAWLSGFCFGIIIGLLKGD